MRSPQRKEVTEAPFVRVLPSIFIALLLSLGHGSAGPNLSKRGSAPKTGTIHKTHNRDLRGSKDEAAPCTPPKADRTELHGGKAPKKGTIQQRSLRPGMDTFRLAAAPVAYRLIPPSGYGLGIAQPRRRTNKRFAEKRQHVATFPSGRSAATQLLFSYYQQSDNVLREIMAVFCKILAIYQDLTMVQPENCFVKCNKTPALPMAKLRPFHG